jgi:glycosyltransferase involved in cell wall biosynthesis
MSYAEIHASILKALVRMRLSIAIMTHNEARELRLLMHVLQPLTMRKDVEVVIVDDFSNTAMQETFANLGLQPYSRQLNGDFAAQRNFLKQKCTGDYVLFLDPDELPAPAVCAGLMSLCDQMENNHVRLCAFPRMNVFSDNQNMNDEQSLDALTKGYDWKDPDYQTRLCRNERDIYWQYTVHEKLVGERVCYRLPPKLNNCLIHLKSVKKQHNQNQFYDQIDPMSIRNIAKRLRLRRLAVLAGIVKEPRWIPLDLSP